MSIEGGGGRNEHSFWPAPPADINGNASDTASIAESLHEAKSEHGSVASLTASTLKLSPSMSGVKKKTKETTSAAGSVMTMKKPAGVIDTVKKKPAKQKVDEDKTPVTQEDVNVKTTTTLPSQSSDAVMKKPAAKSKPVAKSKTKPESSSAKESWQEEKKAFRKGESTVGYGCNKCREEGCRRCWGKAKYLLTTSK